MKREMDVGFALLHWKFFLCGPSSEQSVDILDRMKRGKNDSWKKESDLKESLEKLAGLILVSHC